MKFKMLKLKASVSADGITDSRFLLGAKGVKLIEKRDDLVLVDKDGFPDVVVPWSNVAIATPVDEEETKIEEALREVAESQSAKKPPERKIKLPRKKLPKKSSD